MIFLFAQTLEVFLGFGGTLFALVLGSYFYDINSVLVFLIPLNMLLNLSVIYKDKYFIDFKLLFKKILPLMGVGIIMSLLVTPAFPKNIQYMFVGGALVVCALRALITSRLESEVEKSNNPLIEKAFYLMGGYAQAALGSGGPFISLHITNQKINDF